VGATQDARRAGGQPFHSLTQLGYGGEVFAVNPRYQQIDGYPCFAHVDALPSPVDLAVIAVPATEVAATVEACGHDPGGTHGGLPAGRAGMDGEPDDGRAGRHGQLVGE
jgi:acyl-CoA synthetase (NDP forming)